MWEMDGAFRVGTPKKTKKGMNEKIKKAWNLAGAAGAWCTASGRFQKKKRERNARKLA